MAYDNGNHKKEEYHYDIRQVGSATGAFDQNADQSNHFGSDKISIEEFNKIHRELIEKYHLDNQAGDKKEESYSEEIDEDFDYLMERVYLFSQRKSFWDGKVEGNIEEKIYRTLKLFIDDDYIILPHVAFREIFWWGKWKDDWRLTNRVTKMHFDFGIFNKDLQPILFFGDTWKGS